MTLLRRMFKNLEEPVATPEVNSLYSQVVNENAPVLTSTTITNASTDGYALRGSQGFIINETQEPPGIIRQVGTTGNIGFVTDSRAYTGQETSIIYDYNTYISRGGGSGGTVTIDPQAPTYQTSATKIIKNEYTAKDLQAINIEIG